MKNKQQLIDIIKADAKLQCRYYDDAGNTCVIGGMAEALGFPLREKILPPLNATFISDGNTELHEMVVLLMDHFDLEMVQLRNLQSTNDRTSLQDINDRHDALIELVEGWPETGD